MYQNIKVNIYHLLSQRKAAQIVKVLLIVHTRPKCTNHMYQTVLNCPNYLINQSKVITWSILNADIEQLIQLIHFCLNVLSGDCGRRESRKCHNFNPNSFWIYVSGVCSLPLKCGHGQWQQLRWQRWFVCRHALWLVPCLRAEWLLLPWKCLQFIWTFRFWMFCNRGTVCTWYMLIEHSWEGGMFATTPDNLKQSLLEGLSLFESDRSLSLSSNIGSGQI